MIAARVYDGLTLAEHAERSGISYQTLNQRVKKYGHPFPEKGRGTDYTGKRFGKLTALRYSDRDGPHGARWVFMCVECDRETILPVSGILMAQCQCGKKAAPLWPFPRVVGLDGLPVSPIWRAADLQDVA
ncbi:hypothetical protein GNZ12_24185 [Paraburkholderia sp. 1N]|uniref:Uncharacterized protein n=1 Tax=Paraburkholderia solitsugae TaxID=2675748 RepID=A0ABX2BWI6_9BURK|nr:hypothetical protein [Paraburkholderia solitsugae]NPT44353.1 hypothetical protein [Paraburkholderia solitsugae]